jgi:cytochrome c oxidase subunit 2
VISTTTTAVDNAFIVLMAFCLLLFAVIIFFTIFFAVRYRRSRHPEAVDNPGHGLLELAWIAASTVIAVGMFFYGLTGFTFLRAPPADSIPIALEARQWTWLFTYPNGKQSTELVVPQGKDVALTMTTPDVIHGFFIPAYRIKQDVVPGMKVRVWFNATTKGTADILCTQYCGTEHSHMLSQVFVVPETDYTKWINDEDVDIPGLTS